MPLSQRLPRIAWTVLLDQALDGLRQGGIPPWPSGRWPRLRRRLEQNWLGPIWGTWGELVVGYERWPAAVHLLLHWACGLIRPDHQSHLGLNHVPETAWVEQTAWRPLLAVSAISSLLSVPDLPRHYRRSQGDSALDTLCGLWSVGTSTTYRYADRGKRLLVDALFAAHEDAQQRWRLREVAYAERCQGVSANWHQAQAESLIQHGHVMDAAWHLCKAQQWPVLAQLLKRRTLDLASSREHSELCQALRRASPDPRTKVALVLGESGLWQCLGETETVLNCLHLGIRTADALVGPEQAYCMGQALYALGYFYNSRVIEQAISHLEVAAQQFLLASQQMPIGEQHLVQSCYITTLATLAFLQLRRNSPQAQTLLRSSESAAKECLQLDVDAQGMLLKAKAEEARCHDHLEDALRFRREALVLYERVGDLKEVVECHSNLGQLLAHAGRTMEARQYFSQVLKMSKWLSIRPETLLGAWGGLALTAMTDGELDTALHHLHTALEISQKIGLKRYDLTSFMNLAEVHYVRYKKLGDPKDELQGDRYAEMSRALAQSLGLSQLEAKAQSLKLSTLNPQTAVHHLLPVETSAHPGEFAKIEALRAELALPRPPAQRARTHIALSQLYLRIAAKERDAARGLMQTHGLSELEADIEALQQTWAHDGNLASQLSSRWREQVGDWLTDSQRKAVLERLLAEGSLSKSSYGEAAEVSPATASKHLGLLADKGLLEQQGRGPATRYVLPGGQRSGSRDGAASTRSPGSMH